MPGRHQQCAKRNGANTAEQPVSQKAAKNRRQVNQADINAENLESDGLRGEVAGYSFNGGTKLRKSGDMLDMPRQQQLLDHVQHEQCLHAVEGDAIPKFGGSDVGEAARVAKQQAITAGLFQSSIRLEQRR
ncbi:MAG TPA: hypothetical protein VHT03_14075 [Rhizomicrobium sp.]|jgi:hypothetical protein|nr:hypothetical protein [Rhizomicrobium sp.]